MAAKYDWDRIEADYRTGRYTTRELARMHGPDHSVIAKRAKAGGWKQDLSAVVAIKTKAKLIDAAVAQAATGCDRAATDATDVVASMNIQIIERQRKRLSELQEIADEITGRLRRAGRALEKAPPDLVVELAQANGMDMREAVALLESASNDKHAHTVQKLAGVLRDLIPLERKVHDLDLDLSGADHEAVLARARAKELELAGQ